MKGGAFHSGHELDQAGISDIEDQTIDNLVAEVAMRHLAALKTKRGLYFVALAEESHGLVLLGLIVVFVDCDGELDLFDDDNLLFLARGALTLVFFVEVFAVVLDLADGRDGIG